MCGAIKLTNYRLHMMFDNHEPSEKNDDEKVTGNNEGGDAQTGEGENPHPAVELSAHGVGESSTSRLPEVAVEQEQRPASDDINESSRAAEMVRESARRSSHVADETVLKPVEEEGPLADTDNTVSLSLFTFRPVNAKQSCAVPILQIRVL